MHGRAKLILSYFITREPYILMKAFNSYYSFVRTMLAFSSVIWNPMATGNIYKN